MSARPEADPQIGRMLGGQYRIEALLGAGGMGRVYRGRQLSVNRPVAIKVIAGQAPHPPEWVRRFRREAEATASLSHPNSVRLFDFGVTESEELFMVMELLEGSDLARHLRAHGPLPLVTTLSIARQVLLALCEAHALGITHRDIKPDNIFLASVRGADVVAKVMDFGIAGIAQAQRHSRLTGAGMIIGTPMYMSPEQAQGLHVDGKSDMYSLGVVLFEMLTGRQVFESRTGVPLLLAHVVRAPMRLDEAGVRLREQPRLQALLDVLLAKTPAERPSAAQALEVVSSLAAHLGIAEASGAARTGARAEAGLRRHSKSRRSPDESRVLAAAVGTPAPSAARPLHAATEETSLDLTGEAPLVLRENVALAREDGASQIARTTEAHVRPGLVWLGAALVLVVLGAASALALRWLPRLLDAAEPLAAIETQRSPASAVPPPKTVRIESQPSGAQVLLDGDKIGTTPFQLELQHATQISVAHEGYVRRLVDIPYDARSPLRVTLTAEEPEEPEPSVELRQPTVETDEAPQHDLEDSEPQKVGLDVTRVLEMGRDHETDEARAAELASEHAPPPAAVRRPVDPIRADELAEITLDDDERERVTRHYGLRAFGRVLARAVGRLLIPYPNRERRAALSAMPLMYSNFRDARAAYQRGELDATRFQEAVWQLRERRRQKIWRARDRFARGELSRDRYHTRVDQVWDEFWGPR